MNLIKKYETKRRAYKQMVQKLPVDIRLILTGDNAVITHQENGKKNFYVS